MNWLRSKKKVIATHSGSFHADDVFSVAFLSLYHNGNIKIIRSRDESVYAKSDYVVDVGREYDPSRNKFDHHDIKGLLPRTNGIPFAAFGLLWKELGAKFCGSTEVANLVEESLVQSLDADDNAFNLYSPVIPGILPYTISDLIVKVNSICDSAKRDKKFMELVEMAKGIIEVEIINAKDTVKDQAIIKNAYEKAQDKRIIVVDVECGDKNFITTYPEPLFLIKPSDQGKQWKLYPVNKRGEKFARRIDLPASWAGKSAEELIRITGVPDVTYSDYRSIMAIAKSKEGAIRLAEIALENNKN